MILYIFFITLFSVFELSGASLRFTIITDFNGVGLETDCTILKTELERQGHSVKSIAWNSTEETLSDVNIFLEQFIPSKKGWAKRNWFIPNPEWFVQPLGDLEQVDLILCRTKEVERIFTNLKKQTYYLGFTSPDCYRGEVEKKYTNVLHLAGCSVAKGTQAVVDVWSKNSSLPLLQIVTMVEWDFPATIPENMQRIQRRLSENELRDLQNRCGIHLCPSVTEGFGHYISEAMSTGAVVITTNAPPMNEFITDPRCLVAYRGFEQHRLATIYYVDAQLLKTRVQAISSLSNEELEVIGKNNRLEYLKRKEAFCERFRQLVSSVKEEC